MLEQDFRRYGCRGHAYPPVVAAGVHALTLHYVTNNSTCDQGQLLLVDAGAERAMYNADITRTLPVGGRFTPPQRALYEAVLRVQRTCIAAVGTREGQSLHQLHQVMESHCGCFEVAASGDSTHAWMHSGLRAGMLWLLFVLKHSQHCPALDPSGAGRVPTAWPLAGGKQREPGAGRDAPHHWPPDWTRRP